MTWENRRDALLLRPHGQVNSGLLQEVPAQPAFEDRGSAQKIVEQRVPADGVGERYPDGGRIDFESAGSGLKILITVRDSGAGISPEDLPHVFVRVYRGRREKAENGSGLGLATAKEWAEAMHGRIRISSAAGKGTAAVVEFISARRTAPFPNCVTKLT